MSSTKQDYLKALLPLLKDEKEAAKVLPQLEKVMKKHGHSRLLLPVLRAALRELSGYANASHPRLIIANESDKARFTKKYKDAEVIVDTNIIGGYIYETEGQRLDQSYKTKLLNWYYAAINNK
ncbi:hypothetical protein A2392_01700 [Candidatus Kaiserbacteria bacterium RIFOXYB1_FULL_46_14]|uniref:ATP synthase subunit delta n=1 Tax=Candidatus Kaiserbacteria bacterium RIFOXYB1_FULL_46_14 TaxID=1798531 RepID=A0A1F6FJW8_9BACT|nr:MAG: hypothetical protein A2392_01700 [Candidatus Kaiserbacteria bacterium RIFOXYB1_FULL_46_14]